MKTLILATDFSVSATRAAFFAGKLALDQHAQLILLHAYHDWPDESATIGAIHQPVEVLGDTSEAALQRVAGRLERELGSVVPIQCIAREGPTIDVVRNVTKVEHADLLIMSTAGTAPRSTQLFGSIATGMVAETQVPLLLIPPGSSYMGVKNVVLGIDLAATPDAGVLDTALHFARAFGSVVHVLCVSDKADDADTRQQVEPMRHLLHSQPHTLTIKISDDIYDTLPGFAHANKADLIMMLPPTRNWLQRVVSAGHPQHMARLIAIPLLAFV